MKKYDRRMKECIDEKKYERENEIIKVRTE